MLGQPAALEPRQEGEGLVGAVGGVVGLQKQVNIHQRGQAGKTRLKQLELMVHLEQRENEEEANAYDTNGSGNSHYDDSTNDGRYLETVDDSPGS